MMDWIIVASICFLVNAGIDLPDPISEERPCMTWSMKITDVTEDEACGLAGPMIRNLHIAAANIAPGHPYTWHTDCAQVIKGEEEA